MDWIHCNGCFTQPSGEISFLLTSCGHIFCESCHNQENEGKCKICNSDFKSILMVPDMKPEIKEFFSEPEETVKKLIETMEFQKQHRIRLVKYWVSLNKKYQNAKVEIKKLSLIAEKMYGDMKEVNKQNKMLKMALYSQTKMNPKIFSPFASSSPTPGFGHPSFISTNHSSKPISTPRIRMNASKQNFDSVLVTPHRLNRSRIRNPGECSSGDSERQTIMLTPPSTVSSRGD